MITFKTNIDHYSCINYPATVYFNGSDLSVSTDLEDDIELTDEQHEELMAEAQSLALDRAKDETK